MALYVKSRRLPEEEWLAELHALAVDLFEGLPHKTEPAYPIADDYIL